MIYALLVLLALFFDIILIADTIVSIKLRKDYKEYNKLMVEEQNLMTEQNRLLTNLLFGATRKGEQEND